MTTAMKMPEAPPEFDAMTLEDEGLREGLNNCWFLWPTEEDSNAAFEMTEIDCLPYNVAEETDLFRGERVLVARHDTDEGERAACKVAAECQRLGARSVQVWAVPGYGTQFPTMEAWASQNSLWLALKRERANGWRGFVGFVGSSAAGGPGFLGDPRPIATDLDGVPPLNPAMIPEPFRRWCQDVESRLGCPLEYVVAPLIIVLSGLIGRRIALRPKRHDDWKVIPNLWGAIVGPPGSLKTPAIEEICRPLKRLAEEAIKQHDRALSDHRREALVATARRTAARKDLDRAAKQGADDDKLKELAGQVVGDGDDEAPDLKRYFVNDVTNEKLGELMAQPVNANGLIVFRDELVGFFKSMDRPGHEADRSFFLEAWNGTGSFTFDRIGRGTVHIPHACLSIFGGIQPGPLASYLRGSFSGEDCDGFTQRFQVLMYPDHPPEFRNVDRPPDVAAIERAAAVFRALDALDPAARGCDVEPETGIAYLRFDGGAQEVFDEWRIALERRLRSGSLSALMTTHLSKYRSLMPSLALIFHLIECFDRPTLGSVSAWAAEAAAAWCHLLEAHAERTYHAAMDGDPDVAIRLGERLKSSLPNPFTYRQVAQKGWSSLGTVEEVRRAVGILEDRNWAKVIEVPSTERGGRPGELVWVHPRVRNDEGAKP